MKRFVIVEADRSIEFSRKCWKLGFFFLVFNGAVLINDARNRAFSALLNKGQTNFVSGESISGDLNRNGGR